MINSTNNIKYLNFEPTVIYINVAELKISKNASLLNGDKNFDELSWQGSLVQCSAWHHYQHNQFQRRRNTKTHM